MSTSGPSTTIVVIPAYNEEASLPGVIAELRAEAPDLDIVVVDDGSSDGTSALARAAGIPCVELPFNLGIGGALRAGYRYAVEHGYGRAIQFDGDGQHRADQIKGLLRSLDDGADLAIGSRFAGTEYSVGISRRLAMGLLRLGVRLMTRRRFTDTSSGFRAVQQPLLGVFAEYYPVDYMDSVETLVAACRAGYRVDEISSPMRERTGGLPSQSNLRLAYHYLRLMVALVGASRRGWPESPARQGSKR